MLDTSILIYMIRNHPPEVAERVNRMGIEDSLCMSFVTHAELLVGAERSNRRQEVLRQLAALTRIVPVDYEASPALCACYADHSTRLKRARTPIGANDLWIACHALAQECVLVTNNEREFRRIDGLAVENWT